MILDAASTSVIAFCSRNIFDYLLIHFPSAAAIDALVYELYGLTEEEITIVEDD